jgi:diguanylate cyclase (GGDEF)-like protein
MTRCVDDPERLKVLRDLQILDTPPEPAYDDLAGLASTCCQSPIAAVNFVDGTRHWTKAIIGDEGGAGASVSADMSFCAATISTDDGMLSLSDTLESEEWRSHPLVTGPPFLRFYAGASIVVSGERVGVVCVFGDEPRVLDERQLRSLTALASQASANLQLRKRNASLHELAVHDPLTGLANRTILLDHLERAIAKHQRDGLPLAVLFCDVDGLKQVNDRCGHEAGDRVLRTVAGRLCGASRSGDMVARFAGDEFVVICPDIAASEQLTAISARFEDATSAPADPDCAGPLQLSVGAVLLEAGESSTDVIRRADEAMYRIKQEHRTE